MEDVIHCRHWISCGLFTSVEETGIYLKMQLAALENLITGWSRRAL